MLAMAAARRVADIGCGTAVLAMAAARAWPEAEVIASDIDAVAVDVAVANLAANDMAGAVHCVEAAGFDHAELAARAPYDLIFANILKGPLLALAEDITQALAPGGAAILSGILNEQADEVIARYVACGNNLTQRQEIGDWTSLTLHKAG